MAKNELFLCDAMSAIGLACLNMIPKNYRVHAWTNRVSTWMPKLATEPSPQLLLTQDAPTSA